MSHQDRTSTIVVNHQTVKQVVDWLLAPALFAGMKPRSNATWKPRMLAVAALLWATSDLAVKGLRLRYSSTPRVLTNCG